MPSFAAIPFCRSIDVGWTRVPTRSGRSALTISIPPSVVAAARGSISHDVLLARLRRLFKDDRLLSLLDRIVFSFQPDAGHGLPIGSLTSQHFANFYLGWFDRFVKEKLRVKGFVRYMDDMIVWGQSARIVAAAFASAAR
jgi:hypothetical protein